MAKWVYCFGDGKAEGRAEMRNLLGGKGANLAEMSSLGLPVPPGFTITTEVCTHYYANKETYPAELNDEVEAGIASIEKVVGAGFGDPNNPLLVSVRSGARVSMPGMMDTVLNLGLNDRTVQGLAKSSGDERFAYDSYRRFIQMYSQRRARRRARTTSRKRWSARRRSSASPSTPTSRRTTGAPSWPSTRRSSRSAPASRFPQDSARAALGRRRRGVPLVEQPARHHLPPAARHPRRAGAPRSTCRRWCSATWATTAPPASPSRAIPRPARTLFYGEYLMNAQGEDVVAGIRTPQHLTVEGKLAQKSDAPALEEVMPAVFKQLAAMRHRLETHYRDMQDIEFTIQHGKLYMLQTRNGKRTAHGRACRSPSTWCDEGLIDQEGGGRCASMPASLDQLLHPTLDPKAEAQGDRQGPARVARAPPSGKVVFTADEAETQAQAGEKVILVRTRDQPRRHPRHARRARAS